MTIELSKCTGWDPALSLLDKCQTLSVQKVEKVVALHGHNIGMVCGPTLILLRQTSPYLQLFTIPNPITCVLSCQPAINNRSIQLIIIGDDCGGLHIFDLDKVPLLYPLIDAKEQLVRRIQIEAKGSVDNILLSSLGLAILIKNRLILIGYPEFSLFDSNNANVNILIDNMVKIAWEPPTTLQNCIILEPAAVGPSVPSIWPDSPSFNGPILVACGSSPIFHTYVDLIKRALNIESFGDEVKVLQRAAANVANKLSSTMVSLTKNWSWFSSSKGSPQNEHGIVGKEMGENSPSDSEKASDNANSPILAAEDANQIIWLETIKPGKSTVSIDDFGMGVTPRQISNIYWIGGRWVVLLDSRLGRILLADIKLGFTVVRQWKGYRKCTLALIRLPTSSRHPDNASHNYCNNQHFAASRKDDETGNKSENDDDLSLVMLIWSLRTTTLEAWSLPFGTRIGKVDMSAISEPTIIASSPSPPNEEVAMKFDFFIFENVPYILLTTVTTTNPIANAATSTATDNANTTTSSTDSCQIARTTSQIHQIQIIR